MDTEQLSLQIARLYAALGAVVQDGIEALDSHVHFWEQGKATAFALDPAAGISQAEMHNIASGLNCLIAHLSEYLDRWARTHGREFNKKTFATNAPMSLKIIKDLCNHAKHGGYDGKTHSGRTPELGALERVVRLTTPPGGRVGLRIGPEGLEQVGGGRVGVAITGGVVDEAGERIGDLVELQAEALTVMEELITEWGVSAERSE